MEAGRDAGRPLRELLRHRAKEFSRCRLVPRARRGKGPTRTPMADRFPLLQAPKPPSASRPAKRSDPSDLEGPGVHVVDWTDDGARGLEQTGPVTVQIALVHTPASSGGSSARRSGSSQGAWDFLAWPARGQNLGPEETAAGRGRCGRRCKPGQRSSLSTGGNGWGPRSRGGPHACPGKMDFICLRISLCRASR